ncbi:MAG: type VI secretion system-associated protein VasI [Marinobacter sp.]|nr:type VI secretion system-associated protein VasI [Marinobacter sp.]
MKRPFLLFAGCLLSVSAFAMTPSVLAASGQLDAARECAHKPARLDRLACFDRVFQTPVNQRPRAAVKTRVPQPPDWRMAYALEAHRQPDDGALYRNAGPLRGGQLVTLAALGAVPPRPLMVVQCDNNITELKLMLPRALNRDRVSLSFEAAGGQEQQLWRVRDQGLVVSGGRGLPAIRTLKRLSNRSQVQLVSSEPSLDGLVFDLSGLMTRIQPLRRTCGW